jgi:hypothetical protein
MEELHPAQQKTIQDSWDEINTILTGTEGKNRIQELRRAILTKAGYKPNEEGISQLPPPEEIFKE